MYVEGRVKETIKKNRDKPLEEMKVYGSSKQFFCKSIFITNICKHHSSVSMYGRSIKN